MQIPFLAAHAAPPGGRGAACPPGHGHSYCLTGDRYERAIEKRFFPAGHAATPRLPDFSPHDFQARFSGRIRAKATGTGGYFGEATLPGVTAAGIGGSPGVHSQPPSKKCPVCPRVSFGGGERKPGRGQLAPRRKRACDLHKRAPRGAAGRWSACRQRAMVAASAPLPPSAAIWPDAFGRYRQGAALPRPGCSR
jgi:hypothetical protein